MVIYTYPHPPNHPNTSDKRSHMNGKSFSMVLVLFISFSFSAFANQVSNDQPVLYRGSRLLDYFQSSPNASADMLYVNGKDQPVLIKHIETMPIYPDLKQKLITEGKWEKFINQLNTLRKQHASRRDTSSHEHTL